MSNIKRTFSPLSPTPSGSLPLRSRSVDRRNEPLGLRVVYQPPDNHSVDIIFVHGLGGTSRLSWSWNRDISLFWPQEWLPLEPGLKDARILTFGYSAYFMSQTKDTLNISDFARDLLLQMKFGNDENVNSLGIGEVRRKSILPRPSSTWRVTNHACGPATCHVRSSLYGWSSCQEGQLRFPSLSFHGTKILMSRLRRISLEHKTSSFSPSSTPCAVSCFSQLHIEGVGLPTLSIDFSACHSNHQSNTSATCRKALPELST